MLKHDTVRGRGRKAKAGQAKVAQLKASTPEAVTPAANAAAVADATEALDGEGEKGLSATSRRKVAARASKRLNDALRTLQGVAAALPALRGAAQLVQH